MLLCVRLCGECERVKRNAGVGLGMADLFDKLDKSRIVRVRQTETDFDFGMPDAFRSHDLKIQPVKVDVSPPAQSVKTISRVEPVLSNDVDFFEMGRDIGAGGRALAAGGKAAVPYVKKGAEVVAHKIRQGAGFFAEKMRQYWPPKG